jgi:hypothetical protein
MPSKNPQDDFATQGEQEEQTRRLEDIRRQLELPLPVRLKEPLRVIIDRLSGQTQAVNGQVEVTNFPAVQPVSATSWPLPAGAATAANQVSELALLTSIIAAFGPLATAALQTTGNTSLASILTAVNSLVTGFHQSRVDTYTVAANGVTVALARPLSNFSIQCKGTGAAPTTWDIRLEGSLDGTNFSEILRHRNAVGDGNVLSTGALRNPILFFRSRAQAITLGGASDIVTTILGME